MKKIQNFKNNPKSSGASRHLLFQRRSRKPSLKKRVASHVSAMTGDLRETNSNSKFISTNPPSDCFAISHLLFQRRFGSKTLFEKEGGIARKCDDG
ncbi:MAG: hypothetical protein A3H30_00140 [Alphaproteobacteria bacterium RIFCSPLOWO2_02_FULL_40_19]|nr:MAG: hypothetical protein A3H30_00140 [Alphaproteobacteria bacterium RIFCSPLOWO2_02_FULL_40_19]